MTVETTIQQMFDRYPNLFSTRRECLDHLFCTIGNGYVWKWGQLIDRDSLESGISMKEEKSWHEADYAKPRAKARQSRKNVAAKRKRDLVFVEAGILKSVDEYHWYPLSRRYSKLFSVPRNAKPDWKAAAEECKKMLDEDGIDWRNAQ